MEQIGQYKVLTKIVETRNSILYRGCRDGTSIPVILKILKIPFPPTPSEITRFEQEYKILKSINLDGIIKTYDLVKHNGRFVLVQEDFAGVSLYTIFNGLKQFDLKYFLQIFIKLSIILGQLHQQKIIHRNIKPETIIVNRKDNIIKVTDFGINALLTRENDQIYNPEVLYGTLVYISPEQTGRMNRNVDYRTDLYSLGITFYEIATGTVPFRFNDPLEVIHAHIAREPVPPAELNKNLPEMISRVILKLMAKNAEERYQNAFGLQADLQICLDTLDASGRITPFSLAKQDISRNFIIPQRLFGREKELARLICSFEEVCGNTGNEKKHDSGIILVTGSPGIGKSALVKEIHKPVTAKQGYFLTGKYDQLRRDKPYNALIQAFRQLMKQILTESDEMIAARKSEILQAAGINGKIITDIIPEAELIIGKQPEVAELAADEARNRFHMVFLKFILVLVCKERPVVLFLDDLQWADHSSLLLIKNMLFSVRYLLLIGSYRDQEITPLHPLTAMLDEIGKEEIAITRIHLQELAEVHVKDMLVNFLKCPGEKGWELARLICSKTGGNPFFVNEFLLSLYNEKLIINDAAGGWQWDVEKIGQMRITENVVEFLAGQIDKLPAAVQALLKICACIGSCFDLETPALLMHQSLEETLVLLNTANAEMFIGIRNDCYVFHHDRIREAVYSLIPGQEKIRIHYRIGRLFLEKTGAAEKQDKLFYITDQLNLGCSLITGREEILELVMLNYECGMKAKRSAALEPALTYLETAIRLCCGEGWKTQYRLTLTLYTEAVETTYLLGAYDKMERYAAQVIRAARDIYDAIPVYETRIKALNARLLFKDAIGIALGILKQLHYPVPEKPGKLRIFFSLLMVLPALSVKRIPALIDLPQMTDQHILAVLRIFSLASVTAHYLSPELFACIVTRETALALKYGHCQVQPLNYLGMAIILIGIAGNIEAGYRLGRLALDLGRKLQARQYEVGNQFLFNTFINHWKNHIKTLRSDLIHAFQAGQETGDMEFAAYSLFMHDFYGFWLGYDLGELEEQATKSCRIMKQYQQGPPLQHQIKLWQTIRNLLGYSTAPAELPGKITNTAQLIPLWEKSDAGTAQGNYYTYQLLLKFLFGDYRGAVKIAMLLKNYRSALICTSLVRDIAFFTALAMSGLYYTSGKKSRREYRWYVKKAVKQFRGWAEHAPENNRHRLSIILAEQARILGNNAQAGVLYNQAVQLCRKYEYPIEEGIANELASRFYSSNGCVSLAKFHFTEACSCYARWGARAKLRQLRETNPELDSAVFPAAAVFSPQSGHMPEILDLCTVLKASRAISGEIVLGKLLAAMINIIMKNAGARRGLMILEEKGKYFVEAEGSIDNAEVEVFKSIPVDEHPALCTAMIYDVARTRELLILNDAANEGRFISDPYVIMHKPKSIICIAIVNQTRLSGILYLENNFTTGAFTGARLSFLQILAAQAAIAIDNARLYANLETKVQERTAELQSSNQKLKAAMAALRGEMELAKKIQTVLLPANPGIPGYEIAVYIAPAAQAGGDYYDIINTGVQDWVLIGDVSGHGVPAGLVMMMVQTAIHTILNEYPGIGPAELLCIINKTITENIKLLGEHKYMTLTAFAVHGGGKFVYAGAHQEVFVYRARAASLESAAIEGSWLGLVDDITGMMHDNVLYLQPGDVMLLYTDGITGAEKANKADRGHLELYGNKQLAGLFCSLGTATPEKIKDSLVKSLEEYECQDDVALIVIKRL